MDLKKMRGKKLYNCKLTAKEMQYFPYYKQLIKEKVFEIRNGKIILHFDNDRKMRQIEIQKISWRA